MLTSPRSGYIAGINAEHIGLLSMRLGAGRFKKDDQIDHRTGLILQAKVGKYCYANDPLVEVHARSESEAESIRAELLAAYTWSESPVKPESLIHATIRPREIQK
jgi:thymidine phosphorylase